MTVHKLGGGWGDRIEWFNWDKRKIVGWKSPIPQTGQLVVAQMKSGKEAVFKIKKVERCWNPSDMFFATLEDIGYVGDSQTPNVG